MTAAVGSARAILALRRFASVRLPGAGEGAPAAVVDCPGRTRRVLTLLLALAAAPGCRGKSNDHAAEQQAPAILDAGRDAAPLVAADASTAATPPTGVAVEAPDRPMAPEVPVIVDSPPE